MSHILVLYKMIIQMLQNIRQLCELLHRKTDCLTELYFYAQGQGDSQHLKHWVDCTGIRYLLFIVNEINSIGDWWKRTIRQNINKYLIPNSIVSIEIYDHFCKRPPNTALSLQARVNKRFAPWKNMWFITTLSQN